MSWFHALLTIAHDNDYQNYLDEIASDGEIPPPQNIQVAQIQLIKDLKAVGLWTRMKTGYFFHAGSLGVSKINFKSPTTYKMTIDSGGINNPLFLQGVGIRSAAAYFNQPFKSNEYSGIQTDLTVIQYMPNQPFASEYFLNSYSSGMDVTLAGATDNYIGAIPFHSANTGFRSHGGAAQSFTSTTHKGLLVYTYDGTNSVVYKDGTKTSTALTPVVPNNSINRFILAANNDGVASPTYNRYIAADFLFDRFNDSDESNFRGIWNTYITNININFQYVAEYASHCWFTRNKSAYDASTNKSWIGQCHNDAFNVGSTSYYAYIFEIDNDTNTLSKFKLGSVIEQDDHNEPSILVRSSDSKLFCAWTEHGGTTLRWRISTNALDASAWGAEQTFDPSAGRVFTYVCAFEASNGNIYLFYRSQDPSPLETRWAYSKSTNGGATFSGHTVISAMDYAVIAQDPNDKDILHFVNCYHPDNATVTDNYITHFYFDCSADTVHKSDGTNITASIPVDQTDTGVIDTALISNNIDCWIEDIIVDGSGNPRILYNKIPDMPTALLKDQYYSEWTGSAWTTPYLLQRSATHYMETELLVTDLLSIWYAPIGSFDRADPDRIFSSIETTGHFGDICEIWELRRLSSSSFTRVQRTFDSVNDQWRPFTIESPTNNVFWLDKIYYDHWQDEYFQVLKLKTFQ